MTYFLPNFGNQTVLIFIDFHYIFIHKKCETKVNQYCVAGYFSDPTIASLKFNELDMSDSI